MRRFGLVLAATTLVFASVVTTAGPASASVASTVRLTADTAYGSVNDCSGLIHHTCTLRAAITRANANGGGTIGFNIGGSGVHTIAVGSTGLGALPVITQPVTIDGTTQPGYSGTPVIELNGTSAGSVATGLSITAGPSVVKGLTINRFVRDGIILTAGSNVVVANFIGTDSTGTADAGNGERGVYILNSAGNRIGGTTAAERNVISGNDFIGVLLDGATGNIIQGNYIGTDASGSAALGNDVEGVGIQSSSSNVVGGTSAGAANVISGNNGNGVNLAGATGTLIEGNDIGTDASGSGALGNGESGVLLYGGTGNVVSENSISSNGRLGIDLFNDGVTQNDLGDGDTGTNQFQNFPVLFSASSSGGSTTVYGALNSTSSTTFTLEFFSSPSCDLTGFGEGQTFLGSTGITTDPAGNASFSPALPSGVPDGEAITATATDPSGNTSEFSFCVTVLAADLSITDADNPDPVTDAGSLTYTLTVTNNGPGVANHVTVIDTLDATEKLVSATPGQGSCSGSAPVTCDLGRMTSGQIVTTAIVVLPLSPGTVAGAASVAADEPDPVSGNNFATAATTVTAAPNAVVVTDSGFSPKTLKLKTQGSVVQWNFLGPGQHSATDLSGMGLFDSGLRQPVDDYQFVFAAAGTYKVSDSGSANTGSIKVPVIVNPKSGGTGTTFTVTWAASVPLGYDFDVQIKRPGSTGFVDWKPDTVATSSTFIPDAGTGTYQFRARIEKGATGPASGYSAAAKITVS